MTRLGQRASPVSSTSLRQTTMNAGHADAGQRQPLQLPLAGRVRAPVLDERAPPRSRAPLRAAPGRRRTRGPPRRAAAGRTACGRSCSGARYGSELDGAVQVVRGGADHQQQRHDAASGGRAAGRRGSRRGAARSRRRASELASVGQRDQPVEALRGVVVVREDLRSRPDGRQLKATHAPTATSSGPTGLSRTRRATSAPRPAHTSAAAPPTTAQPMVDADGSSAAKTSAATTIAAVATDADERDGPRPPHAADSSPRRTPSGSVPARNRRPVAVAMAGVRAVRTLVAPSPPTAGEAVDVRRHVRRKARARRRPAATAARARPPDAPVRRHRRHEPLRARPVGGRVPAADRRGRRPARLRRPGLAPAVRVGVLPARAASSSSSASARWPSPAGS